MTRTGVVYTETVVHTGEGRYQVVIVTLDDGDRLTARVDGGQVAIGDRVTEVRVVDGISFFEKTLL